MKAPHPKRNAILEQLLDGIPAKVVASNLNVHLSTVYSMRIRYLSYKLFIFKEPPDPDQLDLDI